MVAQARHEAAKDVIAWAVEHKIGTLAVGTRAASWT